MFWLPEAEVLLCGMSEGGLELSRHECNSYCSGNAIVTVVEMQYTVVRMR